MRLRTLESFWLLKNGLLYSYPSLQENTFSEVVVIGGGITGALVSHALVEKGYQVLLLDKRDIGQGSSSATTSMLQYEIDVPLHELAEMIGETEAVECYRAGIHAIDELRQLIALHGLDCGFKSQKSLFIAHSKKAEKMLYREYLMRAKYNLGVEWLDKDEVEKKYGLKSFGAILSAHAASVDAYKLAHELIQLNVKRGMRVFDQTNIDRFELNSDSPSIHISDDVVVNCSKVIFCTGFESLSMLSEQIAKLFYTYAVVSETGIAISHDLQDTLVWDTDQPYIYMRSTEDGRLLVGGEDSSSRLSLFQQTVKDHKGRKLMKKLENILPGVKYIPDFMWGGIFGTTKDGLPYIGASPEHKNSLFVLGFGGNGITFSVQAMDIVTKMLEGETHPLAKHYAFGR